jgi:uncharacterized protein DUF262
MKRADVVSMRGLFSGNARYLTIAGHRGFVWTPAEVAQLHVDLEVGARHDEDEDDEFAPDERFYLGVIAIQPQGNGLFTLVDGCQRLTTIAMMLAFARDRINDSSERQRIDKMLVRRAMGKPPEPRLRLTPEDHAWFSHFILPPGATRRLPPQAPLGSPRSLLLAARFMEQAFADYDQDDLWRLAGFASLHAAVVRSVVEPGMSWTPRLSEQQPPRPTRDEHYGVAAE